MSNPPSQIRIRPNRRKEGDEIRQPMEDNTPANQKNPKTDSENWRSHKPANTI
jgi:antitoxin component of MazEF toxin-antitoxin module